MNKNIQYIIYIYINKLLIYVYIGTIYLHNIFQNFIILLSYRIMLYFNGSIHDL